MRELNALSAAPALPSAEIIRWFGATWMLVKPALRRWSTTAWIFAVEGANSAATSDGTSFCWYMRLDGSRVAAMNASSTGRFCTFSATSTCSGIAAGAKLRIVASAANVCACVAVDTHAGCAAMAGTDAARAMAADSVEIPYNAAPFRRRDFEFESMDEPFRLMVGC